VAEQSIDGEISLLWQDVDPYQGDVILMSLDTDEPLRMNTFEISGELAARLKDGVLEEGMRVRVHCRAETIEVVNVETGETSDEDVPVVVDVTVLRARPRGRIVRPVVLYSAPDRHHACWGVAKR
jgi:hypothetical protein